MSGFNTTFVTVLLYSGIYGASDCSVSIQLLLLFYGNRFWNSRVMEAFQYNFCYCSIYAVKPEFARIIEFQYNFCYCSMGKNIRNKFSIFVSIQLLLLFYQSTKMIVTPAAVFQYNFCYCSIWMCKVRIWKRHVSIQLLLLFYWGCIC